MKRFAKLTKERFEKIANSQFIIKSILRKSRIILFSY